jgi:hypothetical protein
MMNEVVMNRLPASAVRIPMPGRTTGDSGQAAARVPAGSGTRRAFSHLTCAMLASGMGWP